MAAPSEQVSRKWLEGVEHFSCCGEKIVLRRVALVKKDWQTGVREILCYECQARHLQSRR